MMPASAPRGVMLAPRFDPMVVASVAGRRVVWDAAEIMGTKATVIGILFRMLAVKAEENP